MGRPKGSKNAKVEVVKKHKEVKEVKEVVRHGTKPTYVIEEKVEAKEVKQTGHPVAFEPKPEMPKNENEKKCSHCKHEREIHYGSLKDWCNTHGCNCQEFK